ncbi:hypothetical protein SGGMMB4_05905 (plasmid) [Sodalis glossinidius str. 'morsitans']|uniref:Transposase (putative) YhgA-like domain-containing protein n=2 Tax=Sodalis glossinidius TaxID=63612 RepID=Q2NPZ3_SODGM|nr:hypothetical protein SGP2_0022 [Sodalis glossinidius str. 'morsitans']CAJ34810.1 TpnA protein [Sodalis glossinidius]CAJ34812.1 TpnA protein [Sodalis glossinidius]CRL46933.1 hypothetical protein SGGMMB4_05905 [Sodalis glossinidius str. 'morsitans']
MTSTLSHHDHVFKKFLGDIAVARDFLEIHLPPHLRKHCDFSTLAMASGSFIEDDLKGQCSGKGACAIHFFARPYSTASLRSSTSIVFFPSNRCSSLIYFMAAVSAEAGTTSSPAQTAVRLPFWYCRRQVNT